MTLFTTELDRVAEVIQLVSQTDGAAIDRAMYGARGRLAVAIASGPFLPAAHYFARCRATLMFGASLVMTPMEFILDLQDWSAADIWFFGVGADDGNMRAAIRSAKIKGFPNIRVMTTCQLDDVAPELEVDAISVPVGYSSECPASIPSMISIVCMLLFASDRLTDHPLGAALTDRLTSATQTLRSACQVSGFEAGRTIFVLHDTLSRPASSAIEAYLRQASTRAVQCMDFGEFARVHRRWSDCCSEAGYLLAIPTCESAPVWDELRQSMPENWRNHTIDGGDGGRFANASAMLAALALFESMAESPGRKDPELQPALLEKSTDASETLTEFNTNLTSAVLHKLAARQFYDPVFDQSKSLSATYQQRLNELQTAQFAGIVMDYDGTIVFNQPEELRLGAPPPEVIAQLVRLADLGILIGIATGRGGSAGTKLREALPERLHRQVLVGYFNGACIQTLDVEIATLGNERHGRIDEVTSWIAASRLVCSNARIFAGNFQVTVLIDQTLDPKNFVKRMASCPAIADGAMRLVRSQHTFDIIPTEISKLAVMECLAERTARKGAKILAIGDSGAPQGNDYDILLQSHAISVDHVCGNCDGTWSLFGNLARGPVALQRILQSIAVRDGLASIDFKKLEIS